MKFDYEISEIFIRDVAIIYFNRKQIYNKLYLSNICDYVYDENSLSKRKENISKETFYYNIRKYLKGIDEKLYLKNFTKNELNVFTLKMKRYIAYSRKNDFENYLTKLKI